jgi:hypothetical protein
MPRTKILPLSALLLAGSLLQACFTPEVFPPEPAIGFKSFTTHGDSASLTITFTDGDGDIGLDPSDTQPPFDPDSPWYFNLFLDYQENRNGVWTTPELLLPYRYRVPRITPSGRNKSLRGEISVALKPWPITLDTIQVRFKVRLVDRSLNVSNEETTPAIPVP